MAPSDLAAPARACITSGAQHSPPPFHHHRLTSTSAAASRALAALEAHGRPPGLAAALGVSRAYVLALVPSAGLTTSAVRAIVTGRRRPARARAPSPLGHSMAPADDDITGLVSNAPVFRTHLRPTMRLSVFPARLSRGATLGLAASAHARKTVRGSPLFRSANCTRETADNDGGCFKVDGVTDASGVPPGRGNPHRRRRVTASTTIRLTT